MAIKKSDFLAAIKQVCSERQLSEEIVLEAVEAALISAYKRNFGSSQNIIARIDYETGEAQIYAEKEVTEEVIDDKTQISLSDAKKLDPEINLGEVVHIDATPAEFGRIAAQTAKQVILQRIREAEREALYTSYTEREGEIINGTVQSIDPYQVALSLGKVEATLPRSDQIPTERYVIGQRLRAYVSQVERTTRGPVIHVSRTHRNMLRRLLELEVPEIYNGTVEIKSIAREAGYRSKVAVAALQEGVDPVGSCVGMRGVRIQSIVNELNGEKIDVVQWSPDVPTFIANALSPARVLNVTLREIDANKTAVVVVPDKQLSLAIGKEGQNARLAAKLTGWRIDIKSATEAAEEALRKAATNEEILARVSDEQEIMEMAESLLKKDGVTLSEWELNTLGRVIEIINNAEEGIVRERAAEAMLKRVAELPPDREVVAQEAVLTGEVEVEVEEELAELAETVVDVAAAEEVEVIDLEDLAGEVAVVAEEEETAAPEAAAVDEIVVEEVEEAAVLEVETEAAEVEEEAVEEETEPAVEEVAEAPPGIVVIEEEPVESLAFDDWFYDDDKEREQKEKQKRHKKRRLEYDEDLGQVVSKRRRKPSRQREPWEDYEEY